MKFFARQATLEFDLPESTATAAIALALGSVTTVMARWHHDQTPEHAALLEDVYVNMALGGLRKLTRAAKGPPKQSIFTDSALRPVWDVHQAFCG